MEKTKLKFISLAIPPPPQPSLTYLQNFVGGEIEQIQINKRYCFIVNEAARLSNLPVNEEATKIYSSFNDTKKYIFGNALLVKTKLFCFGWLCLMYCYDYLKEAERTLNIL